MKTFVLIVAVIAIMFAGFTYGFFAGFLSFAANLSKLEPVQ
jgi:hypothetical protein